MKQNNLSLYLTHPLNSPNYFTILSHKQTHQAMKKSHRMCICACSPSSPLFSSPTAHTIISVSLIRNQEVQGTALHIHTSWYHVRSSTISSIQPLSSRHCLRTLWSGSSCITSHVHPVLLRVDQRLGYKKNYQRNKQLELRLALQEWFSFKDCEALAEREVTASSLELK